MKQILTYILIIFLSSCQTDKKNSRAVNSLQKELEKMEEKGKEIQEKLEQNDSVISEIQMTIKKTEDSIA